MAKIINDNKTIRERSINKLMEALLQAEVKSMSEVQKKVLYEILVKGKTFAELKQIVNLTKSRQEVILNGAVDLLITHLHGMSSKLREMKEEKRELDELRQWKRILEANIKKEKSIHPALKELLSTSIYKTDFSGRVKGICDYAGIKTIKDLVKYSPTDFLKIRNSGKKSMTEVEQFFESHGLSWNMDV